MVVLCVVRGSGVVSCEPCTHQVRRESTDPEDLFIGHINGMDNYARGLRAAAALVIAV